MVSERRKEGSAFKNVALSRITLSNSLEAAIVNGNEEEADFCRVQLAKASEFAWRRLCHHICLSSSTAVNGRLESVLAGARRKGSLLGWVGSSPEAFASRSMLG